VLYLWDELAARLEGRLAHLKLWETRNNVFEYSGQESGVRIQESECITHT